MGAGRDVWPSPYPSLNPGREIDRSMNPESYPDGLIDGGAKRDTCAVGARHLMGRAAV